MDFETIVHDGFIQLLDPTTKAPLLAEAILVDALLERGGAMSVTTLRGDTVNLRLEEEDEEEGSGAQQWTNEVANWYEVDASAGQQAMASVAQELAQAENRASGSPPPEPKDPNRGILLKLRENSVPVDSKSPIRFDHLRSTTLGVDLDAPNRHRYFHPLAISHHTAVAFQRHGIQKVVVYGGTNGNSTENELYELTVCSGAWRRLEGRGHVPLGSYSHAAAADNNVGGECKMLVHGGVGLGGSITLKKNLADAHSKYRHQLLFPNGAGDAAARSAMPQQTNLYESDRPHTAREVVHTLKNRNIVQLMADATTVVALKPAAHDPSALLGVLDYWYELNIRTGVWKRIVSDVHLPLARHTASIIAGSCILFGGVTHDMVVSDATLLLDLATLHTTVLHPSVQPTARYSHSVVNYGKVMIVFGGCDSSNETLSDVWAFDPEALMWEVIPTAGEAPFRTCHSSAVVQNRMLVVGGYSSMGDLDNPHPEAMPSVYELYLAPKEKESVCMWREMDTKPSIPRVAYGTLTNASHSREDTEFVFFGGLVTPNPPSSQPPSPREKKPGQDSKPATEARKPATHAKAKHSHSAEGDTPQPPTLTNATLVISFPHKAAIKEAKPAEAPKEPAPLTEGMIGFLRRTKQGEEKKDWDINRQQREMTLQAQEEAETQLFLNEEEVDEILTAADHMCETIEKYNTTNIQSNVPDRDKRIKLTEDIITAARRGRDILRSMEKKEGGPKKPKQRRRRKEGEKFTDFSAAKPLRQVVVLDLLGEALTKQKEQKGLNEQLATFRWETKQVWFDYVESCLTAIREVIAKIKEIKNKYITRRTSSLMENAARHADYMKKLTEIVRKIQHDKIWNADKDKEQRAQRKHDLAKKEQERKQKEEEKTGKKKKKRSASPSEKKSTSHKVTLPERPPFVVNMTKEDQLTLARQIEGAKATMANLKVRCQPAQSAAPATESAATGASAPNPAPGVAAAPAATPPQPVAPADPMAGLIEASEKSKTEICNTFAHIEKDLDELFRLIHGKDTTKKELDSGVFKIVTQCRTHSASLNKLTPKLSVPNLKADAAAKGELPYVRDEKTIDDMKQFTIRLQGIFQHLKFIFLTRQGFIETKRREKVPDRSIKPPAPPKTSPKRSGSSTAKGARPESARAGRAPSATSKHGVPTAPAASSSRPASAKPKPAQPKESNPAPVYGMNVVPIADPVVVDQTVTDNFTRRLGPLSSGYLLGPVPPFYPPVATAPSGSTTFVATPAAAPYVPAAAPPQVAANPVETAPANPTPTASLLTGSSPAPSAGVQNVAVAAPPQTTTLVAPVAAAVPVAAVPVAPAASSAPSTGSMIVPTLTLASPVSNQSGPSGVERAAAVAMPQQNETQQPAPLLITAAFEASRQVSPIRRADPIVGHTATAQGTFGGSIDLVYGSRQTTELRDAYQQDYFYNQTFHQHEPVTAAYQMQLGASRAAATRGQHLVGPRLGSSTTRPQSASTMQRTASKGLFQSSKHLTPGEKQILMMRERNRNW
jgi:hypothetical protein